MEMNRTAGFLLCIQGYDVFFETSKVRKTKLLIRQMILKLNGIDAGKHGGEYGVSLFDLPDNAMTIDGILYCIRKAECEIRTLSNGKQYYEISGDNFGGYGTFVDDGKTIVIKL